MTPEFLEIKKEIENAISKIKIQVTIRENIGKEQYYGKIEYKFHLANVDYDRIKHLGFQMEFRINVCFV